MRGKGGGGGGGRKDSIQKWGWTQGDRHSEVEVGAGEQAFRGGDRHSEVGVGVGEQAFRGGGGHRPGTGIKFRVGNRGLQHSQTP